MATAADAKLRAQTAAAEAHAIAEEQAREEAEKLANAPPNAVTPADDTVMKTPEDEAGAGCSHTPSKAGTSKEVSNETKATPQTMGKGIPKDKPTPTKKATPKKATPKKATLKRKLDDEWVRVGYLKC